MYKKVCLFQNQSDQFLIQAFQFDLTKHRLLKQIELIQSKHFDYPILYLEVFPPVIFLITENLEFFTLNLSLSPIFQGKFLAQKPLPAIVACPFTSKHPSILLNFRSSHLTCIALKPRPSHFSVPVIDEVHWPSSFSQILSISQIRGESPLDFASRKMFCFLVKFSDYACVHSASLDELNKELVPGPWSIRFLTSTYSIISVHNSVIGFSPAKIFQFSIDKEKMLEIDSESVTALMEYSDKCNRILCAAGNKLLWMHVSPMGVKTSVAATLPILSRIDQLVNLNSQNNLTVLCYSIKGESIVITINLKNMTVAEITRWQVDNFYPSIFGKYREWVVMADETTVKKIRNVWKVKSVADVNVPASRIFRLNEDRFLLTCGSYSFTVKLNDFTFRPADLKDLLTKHRTICLQRYGKELVQVTPGIVNILGKKQIVLEDHANFAVIIGSNLAIAFTDYISIYKDAQIVRNISVDGEILSICEKNKDVAIVVKDKGLFTIKLDELVLKKSKGNGRLPGFYYYWNEVEVISYSQSTVFIYKNSRKELGFPVFRAAVLKETLNNMVFFLQGAGNNFLLNTPQFTVQLVDFSDAVWLYENVFLAGYSDGCRIGELEQTVECEKFKINDKISALGTGPFGNFGFSSGSLICFNHEFQETGKIHLKNLEKVTCCQIFNDFIILSSENRLFALSFPDFSIEKTIQTKEKIVSVSDSLGFLIVYLQFSALIYRDFSLFSEVKFLNPEYEEIGKKLEKDDLESIIDLKLSEKYLSFIYFSFINSGRTAIERLERRSKECICVTAKSIHWGTLDPSFCQLTNYKFDFDCLSCQVDSLNIYTLHYNHVLVFSLQTLDSLMILMNPGHIDWRTYKILKNGKFDIKESCFFNVFLSAGLAVDLEGNGQILPLN